MSDAERKAPVQSELRTLRAPAIPGGWIDWEEHLVVFEAYAKKYGRDQSAERIAERGGFGKHEAETLIGRPLQTWRQRS